MSKFKLVVVLACAWSVAVVSLVYPRYVAQSLSTSQRKIYAHYKSNRDATTQQHCVSQTQNKSPVFSNVELNARYIEAVGFDMDFTLAQYKPEYDELLFEAVKRRLRDKLSYPDSILDFKYRPGAICRGLVIDKQRGYVLKIDRNKYVRKAMLGFETLDATVRKTTYNKDVVSFSEDSFVNIDSTSLVIEAMLFAYLMDHRGRSELLQYMPCEEIYRDIREAMTEVLEGSEVKDTVLADPARYISQDAQLLQTIQQLRRAGKKTFLLINSFWDYANGVMKFLLEDGRGANGVADWRTLFDLVIVGANKPAFLTNDALNLFRVDDAGNLHNIEDKESVYGDHGGTQLQLSPSDTSVSTAAGSMPAASNVYQGGCWQDLHRMLSVSYGDKILYVADQMFTDILRSKRSLGWRTCLVVPELQHELDTAARNKHIHEQIEHLRSEQRTLDEQIDTLCAAPGSAKELDQALKRSDEVKQQLHQLIEDYDLAFGEPWGQLFKAGLYNSRFGKQVESYACLYTSKVSNLRHAVRTGTGFSALR